MEQWARDRDAEEAGRGTRVQKSSRNKNKIRRKLLANEIAV